MKAPLELLVAPARECVRRMLKHRDLSSSKYYKEIPCAISKSLIVKYQRNRKCKEVKNLVLPICGDKGKQVKLTAEGIRVPVIFKKQVLPVLWDKYRPVKGDIRQVEFFKREGEWYCSICYATPKLPVCSSRRVVGVDRNSVGNIAVMADLETGKVLKLGLSPSPTKANMRNRRKNLQKAQKTRLLQRLRRKQSRRMTHENHRVSKTIVNYAAQHCCAIAIEDLKNVRAEGSKIKRYSEKNQWAFAQLESFLSYKCALRGVTLLKVNPAYTSQTCSRCGEIHKTTTKKFVCKTCGHKDHRDANASFNIASRGRKIIDDASSSLSVGELGCIGNPQAEKRGGVK